MLAWTQVTVLTRTAQAIPRGARGLRGDTWYTGDHRWNVHIR